MARLAALLALLLLLACAAHAAKVKIGVQPGEMDAAGEPTAYDTAVALAVCEAAALDCELVPLPVPADRVPAVVQGQVDVIFSNTAFTPEREQLVDFISPAYGSGHVILVARERDLPSLQDGWSAIRGKPVCAVKGARYVGPVKAAFGPELVEFDEEAGVVEGLVAGKCIAAIGSQVRSVATFQGMARVGGLEADLRLVESAEPALPVPVAAAMKEGGRTSELGLRLAGGLVNLMNQGQNSTILELEEAFLVPLGEQLMPEIDAAIQLLSFQS